MILPLLLAILPSLSPAPVQVDLVEVNHYYKPTGEHVLDQLIFYDWSTQRKRYDVRAFQLIHHDSMLPMRVRGKYVMRWHDGGVMREVVATHCRETVTQHDPELAERDELSQENRKPLFGCEK